jgi:hypothetical protein
MNQRCLQIIIEILKHKLIRDLAVGQLLNVIEIAILSVHQSLVVLLRTTVTISILQLVDPHIFQFGSRIYHDHRLSRVSQPVPHNLVTRGEDNITLLRQVLRDVTVRLIPVLCSLTVYPEIAGLQIDILAISASERRLTNSLITDYNHLFFLLNILHWKYPSGLTVNHQPIVFETMQRVSFVT